MTVDYQSSRLREFYEISHGAGAYVYRIASGQRDVLYNGGNFVGMPAARLEQTIDKLTNQVSLTLSLAVTHALVTRWFGQMSPPSRISVTVRQLELADNSVRQVFQGEITSLNVERHIAKFLVVSRIQRLIQKRLPVVVDRRCAVPLYSSWCGISQAPNTYAGHVVNVDGRSVGVAWDVSVPAGATWAVQGPFHHITSGEDGLVIGQAGSGADFTLRAPIYGMAVGDHILVSRGCGHVIPDCRDNFNNVVNYVGGPNRPTRNPFFPTGVGVGETL